MTSSAELTTQRGHLFCALRFTLAHGKIAQVEVIGDPERLRRLNLTVLEP